MLFDWDCRIGGKARVDDKSGGGLGCGPIVSRSSLGSTTIYLMATRYQILKSMRSALEPRGFRLTGTTFHRTAAVGLIDVVNLQAGLRSIAGKSTVNLGIYIPEVRALLGKPDSIPEALAKTEPQELECAIRARLSKLVYGNDHWFDRSDPSVGQTIADLLSSHAMPWFERLSSLSSISAELQAGRIPGPIGWGMKAAIFKVSGDVAAARTLLSGLRNEGPDPVRVEVFASLIGVDLQDGG
jgi:Domain of unknown function (DUF4304)